MEYVQKQANFLEHYSQTFDVNKMILTTGTIVENKLGLSPKQNSYHVHLFSFLNIVKFDIF